MSSQQPITGLIPQRDPFIMVGELRQADHLSAKTSFEVQPGNILVSQGHLTEAGLIENIAQSAAARIGYICRQENRPVPLGYIGAVQNLTISGLPKINDLIETEISIKNQIFDVTIISGTIRCGDRVLAQCEMKIFIAKQP